MYSDALYWATSPLTKGREYHIALREETVLRKLIHYSKKNEKITYSNEIIGKHTFLKVTTIEKVIPELVNLGYIRSIVSTGQDGGNYFTRRIINIKWEKLAFVLSEIPNDDELECEAIPKPEVISEEKQVEEVVPVVEKKAVLDVIPIERPNPSPEKNDGNKGFKLTEEKIDWIIKIGENSGKEVTKELIKSFKDEELLGLFYGEDGVWSVGRNLYENEHLIRIERNIGTRCKLINTNVKKDYVYIDQRRLAKTLEDNQTEFRYITVEMYQLIKHTEEQRLLFKTAL